jgi:NhaP-type Na+/H+ or K+/H+ antiporter
VRHSLNLESGLNDGLALPAVLAFAAAASSDHGFVWWRFVLQDVTLGVAFGLAVGWIASRLMRRPGASIPDHQKALYALGVAFAAYGLAVVPLDGNGLIAVYTCAITFGILRPDLRATFESRSVEILDIIKLAIFVVFGALLTVDILFADGWAAVAIVAFTLLVARPVAVFAALWRTDTDVGTRAFMAWFGPKGVATMTFALIVLSDPGIVNGERVFGVAALAVFTSIIVHGLTDTPGVAWIARRSQAATASSPSSSSAA